VIGRQQRQGCPPHRQELGVIVVRHAGWREGEGEPGQKRRGAAPAPGSYQAEGRHAGQEIGQQVEDIEGSELTARHRPERCEERDDPELVLAEEQRVRLGVVDVPVRELLWSGTE
jgi:hypothetical protein